MMASSERLTAGSTRDDRSEPVDACVDRAVTLLRAAAADANERRATAFDPLRGLYVTEREVEAIFDGVLEPRRPQRHGPFLLRQLALLTTDPLAHDIVALTVAAEYVPRFDRVVGFLHDDLTRRTLTTGLLAEMLATAASERRNVRDLLADGLLDRLRIVIRTDGAVPLHDSIRIDPGMLARLNGKVAVDRRLHSYVTCIVAPEAETAIVYEVAPAETLVLWGAGPDAVAAAARRWAHARGLGALRASAATDVELLPLVLRDAALSARMVIVECTDPVRARDAATACEGAPVPVLIEAPAGIVRYDGPTERVTERDGAVAAPPAAYPLPYGRRIVPRRGFDDLVLPPAQHRAVASVADRVAHQHTVRDVWRIDSGSSAGGIRALFGGPPGTGKTLGAEALAKALGRDLYVVDVSTVVSKYIGETEKALATVFTEAARAGVCLFFDEADALFGKRTEAKDAHDRYANIETAYLLQALDLYPDVVVLATNMLANLDDALTRRIDVMVEFPLPDASAREALWRRTVAAAPLATDVDLTALAQRFQLSGGHIQNVVVTAAFRAASEKRGLSMLDVVRAARDELGKLGRIAGRHELGDCYDALRAEDASA